MNQHRPRIYNIVWRSKSGFDWCLEIRMLQKGGYPHPFWSQPALLHMPQLPATRPFHSLTSTPGGTTLAPNVMCCLDCHRRFTHCFHCHCPRPSHTSTGTFSATSGCRSTFFETRGIAVTLSGFHFGCDRCCRDKREILNYLLLLFSLPFRLSQYLKCLQCRQVRRQQAHSHCRYP